MNRIGKTAPFLGLLVLFAWLHANAAYAQCVPGVTSCCEVDNNPCGGVTNGYCNSITKSVKYTASFPDGAQVVKTVTGHGGGGSAGVCSGGIVYPNRNNTYWPFFYAPVTENTYASVSESDNTTTCVIAWCGSSMPIAYCGTFGYATSTPVATLFPHTCTSCPTANPACSAGGNGCALADYCQYPNTGCNSPTMSMFTAGSGPCCKPSGTPIIIDVDGSGFDLTSAADGVLFDFFGNGHPGQWAWTAWGSTNAFLVLPQSGNVTNGSEMFGNLTPQPSSSNPNGFAALAVYDANGDGVINAEDPIWPQLRLWIDANHDGIAQPQELYSLDSLGVTGISVNYETKKYTDQYGNQFRYRARVWDAAGKQSKWAYDVILQMQP